MNLPAAFTTTVCRTFGAEGEAFLRNLPEQLDEYAQRWQLTLLPAFDNLSYNYVTPALRQDGSEVVLKLGVPHHESWSEHAALAFYAGVGCVRLLEADPARATLLLERLRPGAILRPTAFENDETATAILADTMDALWRPAPDSHTMLTIGVWAQEMAALRATFGGGTGPFPPHLVETAERLFAELLASSSPPVVLHGDLHHDNVLSAPDGRWLAIDPKGVIGEREFEVYALLRNPLGYPLRQPDPARVLRRRLDQLADRLTLDRTRMRLWSAAQCVLSAWWDYDATNPHANQADLHIAEILLHLA